jgi:tripartite-type tricarboxylate transporter receptor subunit TctC
MKATATSVALAAASFVTLGSAQASAQAFPQRTITIVAPTAPGGPGDIAARGVADKMSSILGQPIVIENMAGAGGLQGTVRVARAEPDGYTLLVHQTGIAVAPALDPPPPFNVEKDLTAVGLINTSYLVLVGRKSLAPDDLAGLIAWMKTPGNQTRFAHPGSGTLGHLATLVFARSVGVEVDAVSYRGVAPAMTDIVGGHVDLVWGGAAVATQLIAAGTIKGYVVGGPKRLDRMPNVPHAHEAKQPSLDMPFWHAMFAPAATPRPVIDRLNTALNEALADAKVIARYADGGAEPFPANMRSPEVAQAFVKSEIARWSGVARSNAAKMK